MKQVLHDFRSSRILVADVPRPTPQANEVLVRNLCSAVSQGTERMVIQARSRNLVKTALKRKDLVRRVLNKTRRDGILATLQLVRRKLDNSAPLGYSSAGRVVEVGSDITDLRPGDVVACAGAGLANHAEYVCVPRLLCARVPDGVSPDAACFATLGAIAMQGVRQAEPQVGETVLVIGLGIIGQLTAQILSAAGITCLGADLDRRRVASVDKWPGCKGLAVAADTEQSVLEVTDGRGVDQVIITAASQSNAPIELAGAVARERGRIVVVGAVSMNLPRTPFYEKELEVRLSRSYGPGRYDAAYEFDGIDYPYGYVRWTENRNMESFLDLIARGNVRPQELIDKRYSIADAARAYTDIAAAESPPLGIVIDYPEAAGEESDSQRVPLSGGARRSGAVGIGVIGAGNFTRSVILPALSKVKNAQIVAIASARGVNARDLGAKYGCSFCTSDPDSLIESDDVHAVVITTPHHLHAAQALAALRAGKAVYLEKPLCTEPEQLDALRAAIEDDGCFFVGYNRRFAPMSVTMRKALAERHGPVALDYRINAGRIPPGSWITDRRKGGGRLVGEACHFVDLAKFLSGRQVTDVTCFGTGETSDDAVATLHFDDGSVATVRYITSGPPSLSKERIEAIWDGRVAVIDDFRHWSLQGANRNEERKASQDKGHAAALNAFIECARGETPCPFTAADLIETSRITFIMRGDLAALSDA